MVISLASRSASRRISSKALRRTSARSRGFFPAQPSKALLAASTAALASSTVALATEAILSSVAGSSTSKRPPSDAFRHLPPIQRSVGTLARRLSYRELMGRPQLQFVSSPGQNRATARYQIQERLVSRFRNSFHRAASSFTNFGIEGH